MTVINYWTTVSFPLILQEATIFPRKPVTPRGGRRHGSLTRLLEVRQVQFCCSFSWCPCALPPCPNWRHLIFSFEWIYWWNSSTTHECFSRVVSQPRASATPGNKWTLGDPNPNQLNWKIWGWDPAVCVLTSYHVVGIYLNFEGHFLGWCREREKDRSWWVNKLTFWMYPLTEETWFSTGHTVFVL